MGWTVRVSTRQYIATWAGRWVLFSYELYGMYYYTCPTGCTVSATTPAHGLYGMRYYYCPTGWTVNATSATWAGRCECYYYFPHGLDGKCYFCWLRHGWTAKATATVLWTWRRMLILLSHGLDSKCYYYCPMGWWPSVLPRLLHRLPSNAHPYMMQPLRQESRTSCISIHDADPYWSVLTRFQLGNGGFGSKLSRARLECKFYKNEEIWKLFRRLMFCQSGRRHAHHRDLKTKNFSYRNCFYGFKKPTSEFLSARTLHCIQYRYRVGNWVSYCTVLPVRIV